MWMILFSTFDNVFALHFICLIASLFMIMIFTQFIIFDLIFSEMNKHVQKYSESHSAVSEATDKAIQNHTLSLDSNRYQEVVARIDLFVVPSSTLCDIDDAPLPRLCWVVPEIQIPVFVEHHEDVLPRCHHPGVCNLRKGCARHPWHEVAKSQLPYGHTQWVPLPLFCKNAARLSCRG